MATRVILPIALCVFVFPFIDCDNQAAASTPPPQLTPRYVVIDLGTDMTHPSKITNSGYVLGDNQKSSFYVWYDGVARELKPLKLGDILAVEDINEAGTLEGSETRPASNGAKTGSTYHAFWSKDAKQPTLTPAGFLTASKTSSSAQDQLSEFVLPQDTASSPVTAQCSNAAVVPYPAQSSGAVIMPAQLVAATQVIGNGSDGPYLWEMKPSRSASGTFEGPLPINCMLPDGPAVSQWKITTVTSINDGGAIVGTALYKPTGSRDPIAAGLHGVMLMPLAIVRETTPGSGDYEPIRDNGLNDNAILPIYRTESGKGLAETIKTNNINAVLFQNLSSTSISTLVVSLENKSGETDEAKLIETSAGSGIFRGQTNGLSVTLSPIGQTTSDATVDTIALLVNDPKLGFTDEAFTLEESSAASKSFSKMPDPVDISLSNPLSDSVINTLSLQMFSEDFPMGTLTLTETALKSRVFRGSDGTTVTVTNYSRVTGNSMNVAITAQALPQVGFLATLYETSHSSLQYSNYERVPGDEPVETPATDGQGIFYIQMPGTIAASVTLVSGDHQVTVQATPVKGWPNLLRTGKLVLIGPGDSFRAPGITTIQSGPSLELQKYGRTIVK